MEDVLEVYKRPYDPKRPVVCLDETSKQLIGEVARPVSAAPGQIAQYDYEYVRHGVANIFMVFEPLAGQREAQVTERRTRKDWAECLRHISDEMYPDTERLVLVEDNLNTHSPASLYEAFEPAEAKRLADRFEFHYTPKHGSWLDMAEIELGILGRQCLSRRIDNMQDLRHELAFRRFLGPRKAARWQEPTDSRGFSQFPTTGRISLCALAPRAQAEIAESVQIPMNQTCFVPPESAKGQ